MSEVGRVDLERRVLLLAPGGRDASLTQSVLDRAGVVCHCCRDLPRVCQELEAGAGVLLMVEEAVHPEGDPCLIEWIHRQPPWSDLPILVLARPGADSAAVAQSMDLLGNVTVLERPTRIAALVSAVRTALRARLRQYETRAHLSRIERNESALKDADRRKDDFLAVLAHELRNPLAPIRNALQILRMTAHQDAAAVRVGEIMERQVNHMVRLVDDLMEVSRITRGKIELRKEPVEVAAVIRSAVETSRPLIEAAEHQLRLIVPPESLMLEGDPIRLTQIVSNLLNNAAKYTDVGGEIWLTVTRDGDAVMISVRDTGTGIPSEMLPHVFELFTQVDDNASRSQGGLGIGLTLVRSLVEMHGGSVRAHSDGVGQGSEFVIRLPLAPNLRATDRSESSADLMPILAPMRVLVVDDNQDAADSMGALLRLLGVDAHVVYNGPDALAALHSYRPAVVLLDIGMPGMDGYTVVRQIREQPIAKDLTLIALTGWGQEADRDRTRSAGFDYHLIKPADVNALETLLVSLEQGPRSRLSKATPGRSAAESR
jgi:signal transduction histidine kinase/ActR/RegA family two-component response regulator